MGYIFNRQAIQIQQGNLTLYLTYVTPHDLYDSEVEFYSVDVLMPKRKNKGYQRMLNHRRVERLARYLKEAKVSGHHYLPTAILLATDENFEWKDGIISIPADSLPLNVVDGQHRIRGLIDAYKEDATLTDYPLPVVLATGLGRVEQKLEFTKVNTQQVPLDSSMRQQITSDITDMQGFQNLPYIPFWLSREVRGGRDQHALIIANKINDARTSPLKGRILMANEERKGRKNLLTQSSFVNGIKSFVLRNPAHPLAISLPNPEDKAQALLNYLIAIDKALVADKESRQKTMLYRGGGMRCIWMMSASVFLVLEQCYPPERRFTVASMLDVIQLSFNELDDEAIQLSDPEWWIPGSGKIASSINGNTARYYADIFHSASVIAGNKKKNASGEGDPQQTAEFGF